MNREFQKLMTCPMPSWNIGPVLPSANDRHPAASIVMPVYNKACYLQVALDSVLAQSHSNFELVVIDDGSTDAGPAILAAVDDQRVRIFSQPNAGVSAARNWGVKLARSDIILFFDADDWMHEDYLKVQLQTMAAHRDRAFFATTFRRFSADESSPLPYRRSAAGPAMVIDDLPSAWRKGQTFITSCVAVRRGALAALPGLFPVGESFGEDMDLWLRLAEKHGLVLVPEPLIGYRDDAVGNLTGQKPANGLPAYLARLESRARRMSPALGLRRSSLDHVADARITRARQLLAQGRRLQCGQALAATLPHGFRRPRWWVTLLMGVLLPRGAVRAWERYRTARTQYWA